MTATGWEEGNVVSAARVDVTRRRAIPAQDDGLREIAEAERELESFVAWSEAVHEVVADHDPRSCLICFARRS